MTDSLMIWVPIKTHSRTNQRQHWAVTYRQSKEERFTTFATCKSKHEDLKRIDLPLRITLTRFAPRRTDDDNLRGALKSCRDGVADALEGRYLEGDDDQQGMTWSYEQQQSRLYGVLIKIESSGVLADANTKSG